MSRDGDQLRRRGFRRFGRRQDTPIDDLPPVSRTPDETAPVDDPQPSAGSNGDRQPPVIWRADPSPTNTEVAPGEASSSPSADTVPAAPRDEPVPGTAGEAVGGVVDDAATEVAAESGAPEAVNEPHAEAPVDSIGTGTGADAGVDAEPEDGIETTEVPTPAPSPGDEEDDDRRARRERSRRRSTADVLTMTEPSPPMVMPRIIAITNQKGGVGKTTTAVNLGAALADLGYRVLVVDLDPQGNATTGLGVDARTLSHSIYDAIVGDVPIEDCIEPTSVRNLYVAPATPDLAGAEIELASAFGRELKLKTAFELAREDDEDFYDITLIDCPPSLALLTINGLAASDDVIVPIQCEYYALEGLSQLLHSVGLVRRALNPTLDLRGIVLTMYDGRTKLSDQVVADVRAHFGQRVYRTVIPRAVRLSEAPSFGQPITAFDPVSRGAVAYRELAKEVSNGATRRSG